MRKQLAAAGLCLGMAAAALTACGSGNSVQATQAPAQTQAAPGAEAEGGSQAAGAVDISEAAAIAETPVLLTSVGQSADVNVVQTLMTKAGIESDLNATVTADGVNGYKTCLLYTSPSPRDTR